MKEFFMRDTLTIINETYTNLGLFVRDLFLSKEQYQRYHKGQIVTDPSFIEMTYKLGGINSKLNTRFYILSNRANDMRELEQDTVWGLYVISTHAYFKVLKKWIQNGIQVIILLHIKEEDVSFFKNHDTSFDTSFIKTIKDQLLVLQKSPPLKELDSDLWYRHTNFPIGLKEDGTFFKEKEELSK